MATKPESPTEPFKRALAHAARSLAETPDLEVVFSGDGPSLVGNRATLPHPPRDLSEREASRLRGMADQMALRLAHHDGATHARLRPVDPAGAAAFEAIEQARIEAIGSNALGGVRANLTVLLEGQVERKGLARMVDRTAVPLPDVLALLVRERLTGDAPPAGARAMVDLVRAEIEQKAGGDLDRLTAAMDDQNAFARIARTILSDLDLGDDAGDPTENSEDEAPESDSEPEPADSDDGEGDSQESDGSSTAETEPSESQADSGEDQSVQLEDSDESDTTDEAPDLGDGMQPSRPDFKDRGTVEPAYKVYSTKDDEVVPAEELCDAEELARLRAYLDQQIQQFSSVVSRLANKLQRRLLAPLLSAAALPSWTLRRRRGRSCFGCWLPRSSRRGCSAY